MGKYGKNHYFDWAIFNSYVKLPEGTYPLVMTNISPWEIAMAHIEIDGLPGLPNLKMVDLSMANC